MTSLLAFGFGESHVLCSPFVRELISNFPIASDGRKTVVYSSSLRISDKLRPIARFTLKQFSKFDTLIVCFDFNTIHPTLTAL